MNLYFKALISVAFIFIIPAAVNAQTLPTKTEIISKMRLVNDYWISQNTVPGNNQWARAVYFTGNIDFYKAYPKDSYLGYANLWANNSGWALNGGSTTRNADNQTCGQAYIDMYNLDSIKQPNKISAIKNCIDNMVFSKTSNDWTWIDALFMAMPVFARVGVLAKDTTYFSRMYDLYAYNKYTLGLYNATEGLWYRDASYKPPYATKNGQDCYWARGNGWVIGAHARILQLLPANDRHRVEYIQTFQAMAAALKDRQRTDGFWNSSLDDPNEYNGPETSGTAFFTYGIAWGINNHLLDSATYYPIVQKAWNALVATAVQSTGFLGYVQGVGAAPALATANSTQDFGVGGFLLAGTEVLKLALGTMPVPTNFGMNIVKAVDKNHISVTFLKPLSYSTALTSQNYSLNNNLSVISCTKGSNDSTIILTVSDITPGSYKLQITGVSSSDGEQIEAGESKNFAYSGVVAVSASDSEVGTSNTPDKTLDFDLSTRWSSSGIGQ
jgi:rhamnogalacturonyl hydrolase YesR